MKKIMIVNTSMSHYGNNEKPTGLWLGELVHFYEQFSSSSVAIDMFNINGGSTPIDPISLNLFMADRLTRNYYKDERFMDRLRNSPSIDTANPNEYDAIYFTGGHGVMFDFPNNQHLQSAIEDVYNNGCIVAAVCHGVAALLNAKDSNGQYIIENKRLTGFSNLEEILANRKKIVPFMLEDELKKRGANYSKAKLPFRSYVLVDGQLVTGQNPQSPKQLAQAVYRLLK